MRQVYFVLSAGRTATVFLQRLLDKYYPHLYCQHEPSPARYELLLGNTANRLGVGRQFVDQWVRRTRQKRLAQLMPGQPYVEINPLLCPVVDALIDLNCPLNVVHLVRHPRSWVQSMLAFKASGSRKYIIDYLPFARPYPVVRPGNWDQLSPAVKTLWQWRACNERIAALAPFCNRYTLLHYEHLFSASDQSQRAAAWHNLFAALDLAPPANLQDEEFKHKVNSVSQPVDALITEVDLQSVCGDLMGCLGYQLTSLYQDEIRPASHT